MGRATRRPIARAAPSSAPAAWSGGSARARRWSTARDALVRPFVASPLRRRLAAHPPAGVPGDAGRAQGRPDRPGRGIDPGSGPVPGAVRHRARVRRPGHRGQGRRRELGSSVGDVVVVPWAVSCGSCYECGLGLTAKCATMRAESPAARSRRSASGRPPGPGAAWSPTRCGSRTPTTCSCACPRASTRSGWRRRATTWPMPGARWSRRCGQRPGGTVLVIGGAAQSIGLLRRRARRAARRLAGRLRGRLRRAADGRRGVRRASPPTVEEAHGASSPR